VRRYRSSIRLPNPWFAAAIVATAAYAAVLSAASIERHDRFGSYGYDLGIFSQAIWLIAHGHAPFSTIRGRDLFADHFQPGLALLAPLGRLDLPTGVLVLQSVLLALPAPLLYVLARRRGARRPLALAVSLLWLASPLTQWPNLFDYHPETAVPVLMVLGAVLLERDRTSLFVVSAALACSFKEDVPLVYAMWGVVLWLEGRRRFGPALTAGALAWTALAFTVAIPAEGGNLAYYSKRFAGDRGSSVGDVFRGLVEHPVAALNTASTEANVRIVIALLLTSGGLALLAPRYLLLALPGTAANILSAYGPQHDLHLQYQLIPAAGVAIAGAYGAGVLSLRAPRRIGGAAAAVLVAAAVAFTVVKSPGIHVLQSAAPATAQAKRAALALIPAGAVVAAAPDLAPHLATRLGIYELPEPFLFLAGNGQYWSRANVRARVPTVSYVIDDGDPRRPYAARLMRELRPRIPEMGFRLVFNRQGVRVWRRT
jgi:uncharacterized membrane protein